MSITNVLEFLILVFIKIIITLTLLNSYYFKNKILTGLYGNLKVPFLIQSGI